MKIAATQVEGIGFAIPSNEVKVTIEQLVKHGKIDRPSIGIGLINLKDIPEEEREQLHTDSEDGIYVAKADSDIDLKKGDIITEIDGKKIKDDVDLRSYLYENKKPGESVTVTVIRDGKTKEVKVKLKQQKEQPKRQSRSERQSPGQGDRDFFR
ncbi:MAG: S1C family serine protease, partial [Staphylococcus aureus]|nr:S1C family serine protease [Staphylococcus aureus]